MNANTKIWDVVVIGGGPAGMMAAGRAAEIGKEVLLIEKNSTLGNKLLLTGGGRCNLANYKPDMKELVASYKGKPKALFSVFSRFGVKDSIKFFNSHGMKTKIEEEARVFPVSDKATSVLDVLIKYMKLHGVSIKSNKSIEEITLENDLFNVKFIKGSVFAKSCIIATGGLAYPETGSTGDGFKWLKDLGHNIIKPDSALVPIAIKESWVKDLAGLSLLDAKINVFQKNKKMASAVGKVLFTHFGVSGPGILNLSKTVGELLKNGEVAINLDLMPHLDDGQLKNEFDALLAKQSNKMIKNVITELVPAALGETVLELAEIEGDIPNHSLLKEERLSLRKLIKALPMTVDKLLGMEKAIVSSGGVDINEINFQNMQSKIVPNLYVVGDALNIDRPSGGYSLQICWSTGYVAGDNC